MVIRVLARVIRSPMLNRSDHSADDMAFRKRPISKSKNAREATHRQRARLDSEGAVPFGAKS